MSLIDTSYRIPFRINYVNNLLDQIISGGGQQGILLETLVWHLIRTIPSLQPISRTLGKGGEVDIRVRNSGPFGQPLKWMDDYFLVECKDTNDRVSEKEFGHFLTKMLLNKTNQGIIVSRNGLAGRGKYVYASRDQKIAYSQLNMVVLDISISNLQNLRSTMDFLLLLQKKYESLRFGVKENE